MSNFKDFKISPVIKNFSGDKIPIKRIFNREIKVLDFKLEPSRQKENSQLLTLHIEFQDEKRVVFTGSSILIQQIQEVPKNGFPFTTTIINDNEYYEFT